MISIIYLGKNTRSVLHLLKCIDGNCEIRDVNTLRKISFMHLLKCIDLTSMPVVMHKHLVEDALLFSVRRLFQDLKKCIF